MFKRFWWVFLVMLPVGALAGLLVAAVITYVMPKKYESEATLQIAPPGSGMVPPGGLDSTGATVMTPQFFANEFEKLTSRNSLERVVDNLDFANRWNVDKASAVQILRGMVVTEKIRGTDLVSIRVRHTNNVDARDIAAEVALTYREYRFEMDDRKAQAVLHELNKAVRDQEDKVEERRKVLSTIVRIKGIVLNGGDIQIPREDGDSTEEATNRSLDIQDYVDAKRELEMEQELLQQLKLKLMAETVSAKIPNHGVDIHDEPVIAEFPVSPNVTLNLVLGTVFGLLVSPLMALPLMWIFNYRKPAGT